MPKQGTRAEVNTFVKGLITEASPLNFPANASLDEINFELRRDGTRRRRQGISTEVRSAFTSASSIQSTYNTAATNTYVWSGVNGNASVEYLVVQVGAVLQFFDLTSSILGSGYKGSVTLSFNANTRYSFASINGKLVVAGGGTFVYSISYVGGVFTATQRKLKVRDIWGVQESDADTEADAAVQPLSLTNTHRYNLQNQSWGIPRKDKLGSLVDPSQYYFNDLGKYPSSTETVWNGLQFQPVETDRRDKPGVITTETTTMSGTPGGQTSTTTVDPATGEYTTVVETVDGLPTDQTATITTGDPIVTITYNDPYERMFNNLYVDRLGADLKAAKGYYVIELLNRGASRQQATQKNNLKHPTITAATGFVGDYNTSGATVVCEFAGRMFYSGFDGTVVDGDARSPSLADYVMFSKLVQNDLDVDLCYQEGDPTSRDSNDVVDTDGGFISISGAKKIVAMHNLGTKLIVFASNGVWAITGGSDYGFNATNYKVDKLSSFGCVSAESVVTEGANLLYWGKSAIYAISPGQVGDYVVEDITAATIQTLYNKIPESAKATCQGVYDFVEKKLRWVYKTGTYFTNTFVSYELVFDTVLKCFFQHKISNPTSYNYCVAGVFYSTVPAIPIKYFTLYKEGGSIFYTFSTYGNTEFKDWGLVDAKAYLLTGATTAGDNAIDKQAPYVTVHMLRTETGVDGNGVPLNQSSCKMSGRWEWANNVSSHKISGLYEVYKYRLPQFTVPNGTFDNGFETVVSKNKVRGQGKALSLYFETSPGKDCVLLGWSMTLNGNAVT